MATEHSIGLLMAAVCALLWSVVAIAIKYVLTVCHAETIIWSRFFVSFLVLALFYLATAPKAFAIFRRPPLLGVLAGLALAGNYFGHTMGVHLTTPSNAQILVQLAPLLLAVAGVLLFKERLTNLQKFGFVLAMVGGLGFYRDQIANLVSSRADHVTGDLWLVAAAVFWAAFAASQKVLLRRWTPQQLNMVIYSVAALVFLPQARFGDFSRMNGIQWLVLAFLAGNTLGRLRSPGGSHEADSGQSGQRGHYAQPIAHHRGHGRHVFLRPVMACAGRHHRVGIPGHGGDGGGRVAGGMAPEVRGNPSVLGGERLRRPRGKAPRTPHSRDWAGCRGRRIWARRGPVNVWPHFAAKSRRHPARSWRDEGPLEIEIL